MAVIKVYRLGLLGVNVDKDPLQLEDQELRQAQNAYDNKLSADGGLSKRPGLIAFNTSTAAGPVVGGIGIPLIDASTSGTHYIYIGRGTA